jgi:spermidine synthase
MMNETNILNEMLIHTSATTHQDPQNALIIGETNENFKNNINRHNIKTTYINNLDNLPKEKFDIIMAINNIQKENIVKIDKILEPRYGICCYPTTDVINDIKAVSPYFWIVMPYHFYNTNAIFASKKYHPQADIRWSISDMITDTEYYNSEIQNASFVYPQYFHEKLTGVAKR